ncbi:MAG: acyl-CoA dehydrogenase family protein [Proteobacteria bacterium]|nr:acyl-CoA dehydrogenase family protein [Pseudomonadota bacterium]
MSTTSFNWQDVFLLETQLTDEERQIRDSSERFADTVLAPRLAEDFQNAGAYPQVMHSMGEAGLLGMTLTAAAGDCGESYGGANYVSYGLAARAIERIDSGYRSMLSVQSSLVMFPIAEYGSAAQKERYLPALASGKSIGCFGLTEANAGTDVAGMSSRADKTANGYRLNGSKAWISNSPIADLLLVWVKSSAHDNQVRGFLLERDMAGVSTQAIDGKWSLRTSITGNITLHDVEVREEALLPLAVGIKAPFTCLNRARYGIAWGVLGAAEYCWHAAREYGLVRRQFNRPLAQTQLFQKKLADMQTEITLGLQAVLRVGRLFDEGRVQPEMISLIKRNNCGKALDIARLARDMHGGNGISEEYGVIRHLLNLETVNTYEGTHDAHALILGRAQTGLSAF